MKTDQTQILTDVADPARIQALNAVLGLTDKVAHPFAHHVFFWDVRMADDLGTDGHPKVGGLIPDMGLPRRMWAGGQLSFAAPLIPGRSLEKRSSVVKSTHKTGRSGPLGFVTLRHDIFQDGALCVTEHQDLVYRAPFDPTQRRPVLPTAPQNATLTRTHRFTTTELFRYSALTHNGHRIHYDRDYAIAAEGYAGIVVHGPLLAQYLMLMAEAQLGHLTQFSFRATSPLMDTEEATFCAAPSQTGLCMWVKGPDGRQCMEASAQ